MKNAFNKLLATSVAIFIFSCSKSKEIVTTIPPIVTPPVVVSKLVTLPAGWTSSTTLGRSFPNGVQVYQFDSIFLNKRVKAFCVAYDSKDASLELKPVLSKTAKTVSEFVAAESGVSYACINGGFFGGNQSYSLVKYNGVVAAPNIKALTRVFNGSNTTYYPTRAAFGVDASGSPSVGWVYNVGAGNDLIYNYPSPSPNLLNTSPQIQPNSDFPQNGVLWTAASAIGGSPVLIKENTIEITDNEELISIDNTSSRPRSSIGYTANGIVMILAVEGGNTIFSGINLVDLATMLKSLGCTNAINLDGGGSTALVVGGIKVNVPGDSGVERAVASAVFIKKK